MSNLVKKTMRGVGYVKDGVEYALSVGLIAGSVYDFVEGNYEVAIFGFGAGLFVLAYKLLRRDQERENSRLLSSIEETGSKLRQEPKLL